MPPELDLVLRFRAHALMQALERKHLHGVIDLTPGIRSLQVHYQPEQLPLADLLGIVTGEWDSVCAAKDLQVPSRIVHLPLSWDDPACQLAIEKYMTTVRKDAPWCPSNLEFIRRINDLPNLDEVQRTVFDASYLVMGLGDVYLGAPVATPLDPRHRLVTTKYNPARTWTAEKLGRHRRRLHVRVRHGGPRWLSVRRSHAADVESLPRSRRVRRQAVAAALLRPDPVLPGERR